MATSLRVLLIEDSEDDAALLLRELRRGGYEPLWERVDSAEALAAAVARGDWDLITCDWVMPAFSALAALDLLRARACDLPVIIVSGEVGEEVAVSALKNGAHDYVSKHRLARLLPAVERELRDHAARRARRRAEASLRRAQERLQLFVEQASEVIFTLDQGWRLTSVNAAATAVLGYEPSELVGRPALDLVTAAAQPAAVAALARVWRGEGAENVEIAVVARSGATRVLEVSGGVVHGEGESAESFHIARDVTEQRRADAERARLSAALEQSPDPVAITDERGRLLYLNAAGERIVGVRRGDVQGRFYAVTPAAPGARGGPLPLEVLVGADGTWSGEILHPHADGRVVRMEVAVSPIRDGGGRIVNYVSRARPVARAAQPTMPP